MYGWAACSSVAVSVGQCVGKGWNRGIHVWLALGAQRTLGSVVVEDPRDSWPCSVWVFASCVIRLEEQGAGRFGWSVGAGNRLGILRFGWRSQDVEETGDRDG